MMSPEGAVTRRFAFALLALFPAFAAHASASQSSFTVPISVIDGYVIVDVRVNGAGPFHFIFDSSAGFVILAPAAQQLALKTSDWGDGFGDGENKVHFRRVQIESVQLGQWQSTGLTAGVVPANDVEAVFGTFPLSGFIGGPLLNGTVVKLDYVHKSMTFTPADRFAYSGRGAVLPFHDGRVMATVDGLERPFLVDTGTSPGLTIGARASREFDLASKYHPSIEAISDWGFGGAVRTQLARAHVFELGDIKIPNPVLGLSLQKRGTLATTEGHLGYGVLSRFDVTFDESRSRIIFERNADFDRAEIYDRSGMWIGPSGKFFEVVDVVAGGPADAAGIKPGDTILKIDDVSTANLALPVERERMIRDSVGTKVTLLLRSGEHVHSVTLTLRDLI